MLPFHFPTRHRRCLALLLTAFSAWGPATGWTQAQSHPVGNSPPTPTMAEPEPARVGAPAVGSATQAWLDQQRLGRHEAPPQAVPGELATEVWKRYVKSFGRDIPEVLGQQVEGGKR